MHTFVYGPREKDYVIEKNPGPEIAIVEWPNTCRHVVGGVHLQYFAAKTRNWCRSAARNVAMGIVQATTGIAWDDKGLISLVVPARYAWQANELMTEICRKSCWQKDNEKNMINMLSMFAAKLVLTEDKLVFEKTALDYACTITFGAQFHPRYKDEKPVLIEGGKDHTPSSDWL